jgi:preprotein translocase subunit SecG
MNSILLAIHILVCLSLIGIVLIQGGKGAEVGAAFGAGSSGTVFGATGAQSFLSKLTTGAAVIFMLTSLALAIFWGQPGSSSVMPDQVAPTSTQSTMPVQSAVPTTPAQDSTPALPVQEAAPATPAAAPVEEAK